MRFELRLDIFALFIFLGVCQGIFLSYFFLKKDTRKNKSNLYLGLLILSLSLVSLDVLLNYTGYMVKIIYVDNFSEPINFAIAPLFYLYIRNTISFEKTKKDWIHFILFGIYFIYCFLYFLQTKEFKYNSFLQCYHPDWEKIAYTTIFSDDPLYLRKFINETILVHFIVYVTFTLSVLSRKYKEKGLKFFTTAKSPLNIYRTLTLHFIFIIFLFVFVKIYFTRDLGDYFIASYIALLLYIISFYTINKSLFISESGKEIFEIKYTKSSLTEPQKIEIIKKLDAIMHNDKYFTNNLASLERISKLMNTPKHHVSQAINEKLNKTFFELLAEFRVNEAKKLLSDEKNKNITIDEIAEMVGYNSKSAFNNAFKKISGTTPANYRNHNQ
ncbi:MAG: AraC family transcriptional regulator [Bacteroidales bacterium]|jgi:AraC-like DNA-binding protein|nr:AraC family transcriptional regulator [Bacteroidales bacterium]